MQLGHWVLLDCFLSPVHLSPVLVSTWASLFGRRDFTCRRNTILLASCISLSSCSWWASSCSSHDFSSSWPSCLREGHSPQRATSSERMRGRETRISRGEFRIIAGGFSVLFLDLPPKKIKKADSLPCQPARDFFSVGSDLSPWGSPWPSWSAPASSLGVSLHWVMTYSSLGECAGLAELRLKQMVTGRIGSVCTSCQTNCNKWTELR